MSGQSIQSVPTRESDDLLPEPVPPGEWDSASSGGPAKGPNLARIAAAIGRFKWLVLLIGVLGAVAGWGATQFIDPEYEVSATILLEQGTGTNRDNKDRGPIQAEELLKASGWQDLLRSYAIADPVVTRLGLFVQPAAAGDSVVFRGFQANQQRLRPGDYRLSVANRRYVLALQAGVDVERGVLGDSIGRTVGFLWQPSAKLFDRRRTVDFTVRTPRETSEKLIKELSMTLNDGSSFLFLKMTGREATMAAATLNAWVEQFVAVATALKKKNITYQASILEGQQQFAAQSLANAENALESFRIRTVTEPSERQAIQPGLELTNSPVFDNYFKDKILADSYTRDRTALERILAQARQGGTITAEAVLSIPIVTQDPAAENLRKVLVEQQDKDASLRRLRETYTDEFQRVRDEQTSLSALRTTIVPNALESYLRELRQREQLLTENIDRSSRELRSIPTRTIEEQRLKRTVEVSADMYRNLNLKAAEAKLAEAATIPDVSILSPAVPPLKPTRNTIPVIIGGAIGLSLALGLALAVLLDQTDKRFRYPEQVTNDLGLFVLGVVPTISGRGARRAERVATVVESFRSIRMNVRYAADPSRPLCLTITSPGPNDGKSLISSNLALSFAESGARTLLIDADLRRGELSKTFGCHARPGLVEYLEGTALIAEVLRPTTAHTNLTLMPGGARRRRAPELLATPRLTQLIAQMASEFDVVIVDSPPLGAGFDAYALATATTNMALVMRAGISDRRMANAKMAIVNTLPVRVTGAVLNGIDLTGIYEYYSYYQDYAAHDEEAMMPEQDPSSARESALLRGGVE